MPEPTVQQAPVPSEVVLQESLAEDNNSELIVAEILNNTIQSVTTYKEVTENILTYENYIALQQNRYNNVENTQKKVQKKTLYFVDKLSKMSMKLF